MPLGSPEKMLPSSEWIPGCPASRHSQNPVKLQPMGLATPIPVTTTLSIFPAIFSPLLIIKMIEQNESSDSIK
jgi:hypothetical protein